jgi:hypothetical protein
VLCTRWVRRISAASVRLEFREVVIQEIYLGIEPLTPILDLPPIWTAWL